MKRLIEIFEKFDVEEYEVAEMVYAYLIEYAQEDQELMDHLYKTYLRG